MKIEAVTVSIGYANFLHQVLPNKKKVDRWVVITHESDIETRWLCRQHKIECVLSKRIYEDAPFAKGRAVNEGLDILDRDGWILHVDSDALLPDDFRTVVERDVNNTNYLYYTKRYSRDGIDVDQQRFDTFGPTPLDEIPEEYKQMNAAAGLETIVPETYVHKPYGFFQLWHSSQRKDYSQISTNADIDDVYTSYSFYPRWHLLPLRITDINPHASNWDGPTRKSQ